MIEVRWNTPDWEFHSAHPDYEVAKMYANEVFHSFPYDIEEDGVRLRRAYINFEDLNLSSRAHWVQYCDFKPMKVKVTDGNV